MVGATIHVLTAGLDSGPIVRHAVPTFEGEDPFHYTMKAVVAAHKALVATLRTEGWPDIGTVPQDRSLEVRYTRNADFTNEVTADFLRRRLSPTDLVGMFEGYAIPLLVNPHRFLNSMRGDSAKGFGV